MADPARVRLLVLGMAWPPETFLANLLGGLAARGFEITVGGGKKPGDPTFRRSGFRWLALPAWEGPWPLRLVRLASAVATGATRSVSDVARSVLVASRESGASRRLDRLCQLSAFAGRRWDLIYFPWNATAVAMRTMFALGTPVAVSCRGSQLKVAPHDPRRSEFVGGLAASFEAAAGVHCVSQDILDDAISLGLDPSKAEVIRPAVDTDYFCPLESPTARTSGPEDRPFRVITTGSIIWKKGHVFALEAVARLIGRGVATELTIIGDGPDRQRIRFTALDLGIDGAVSLRGRLDPEQVRDSLRRADAFVLPSLSEGISNAVLEAMASGLPVVTTDCGGMREAVDDGVEGFVVPVRDAAAMADALAALAADAELRVRMGRAGRARVLREFNFADQVDRWQAFCRRIIARCRR